MNAERRTPNAERSPWLYAVGVGANLGDRTATIASAVQRIDASGVARITTSAPPIVTAPVGGPDQPPYLNSAWVVASRLGPHQFLDLLQRIEWQLGRVRGVRWGPRTLDLDLLLRDDGLVVDTPVLTLPHPRLHERAFALAPLALIAPTWRHPLLHTSVATLAERLASGGLPPSIPSGSRQA